MKTKFLLFSVLAVSAVAQAQDDYFSGGLSILGVSGDYQVGAGFTAARIHDGNQWGVVSSFDLTKKDDAMIYDFFVGPIYQPISKPWLRVYPLIGFGYYYLNGHAEMDGASYEGGHYDRPGFAYGAGFQFSLEDSPYYLEFNYKRLEFPNELAGFNFDVTYLGMGYNF
jgi:hypothetical protein